MSLYRVEDLEFTLYYKDIPVAEIEVIESLLCKFHILTEDERLIPIEFRGKGNLTSDRLNDFIQARILPITRQRIEYNLESMGLKYYDVDSILKAVHGLCTDDCYWFKFPGETLTYKDFNWRE